MKNQRHNQTSEISGFYKKTVTERLEILRKWANIDEEDLKTLEDSLTVNEANNMIENVVGTFRLPLGIGTNFRINNKEYLIPMAIEEPSVVAAVSYAARLFRSRGGITTRTDSSIIIGQIQVLELKDIHSAKEKILANKQVLMEEANTKGGTIIDRGGGSRDIEVTTYENTPIGPMMVIHLLYDTQDAMGANTINTAVEHIAPHVEKLSGGRVNLRILSNLADRRLAFAEGRIKPEAFERDGYTGEEVIDSIVEAAVFAEIDPYRATTHNKGIMNGIDAVIIATGNDWRAVEAGAHAYAARSGQYRSLTTWKKEANGDLYGSIELPMAVGIVGGATRVHPTAQLALKILGVDSAQELAGVVAAVGLAQNLAAIRALATDGIQQGHMRMHARQLAVAAGARSDQVMQIVDQMIDEKNIRLERAKEILNSLNN